MAPQRSPDLINVLQNRHVGRKLAIFFIDADAPDQLTTS